MSSATLSLTLFLLTLLHASSAWDTSNIWFPDTNNPVFYNMTFYQEASKAVERATATPPRLDDNNRNPSRPAVDESIRRPTATPAEPDRKKPTRNRLPSRGQAAQQGIKVNRVSGQQNSRRPETSQETSAIGFRSQPLHDDNAAQLMDMYNRNNRNNVKANRQPSQNRLEREDYEANNNNNAFVGQGFGGNREAMANSYDYNSGNFQGRNLRQSSQENGWNGNTNTNFEAASNAIGGSARNAVLNGGNRRDWNNQGMAGSEATNTVETDISAIETSSMSSGPSKCVWAIISCCKPTSQEIRYMCFETLGCHGAFWDINPCSKEMTLAAVKATANFYNAPKVDDDN